MGDAMGDGMEWGDGAGGRGAYAEMDDENGNRPRHQRRARAVCATRDRP